MNCLDWDKKMIKKEKKFSKILSRTAHQQIVQRSIVRDLNIKVSKIIKRRMILAQFLKLPLKRNKNERIIKINHNNKDNSRIRSVPRPFVIIISKKFNKIKTNLTFLMNTYLKQLTRQFQSPIPIQILSLHKITKKCKFMNNKITNSLSLKYHYFLL